MTAQLVVKAGGIEARETRQKSSKAPSLKSSRAFSDTTHRSVAS